MKASDFNAMLEKIKLFSLSTRLVAYKYNSHYMLTSDGIKQAKGLYITMSHDGAKIEFYNLYDLKPNKHGGHSYQDSKTVSSDYCVLTLKQTNTLNAFFEGLYHANY